MRSFGARWLWFPFLKLTRSFRRCSPCKTAQIIAILCFITFLFLILNVGHSQQPWSRRRSVDPRQRPRGGHHLDADPAPTSPLQTQAGLEEPSRFNVVYITLKSKSSKPANNPDTARPKPRKRARLKSAHLSQRARLRVERPAGQANLSAELEALWREGTPLELPRKSYNDGSDSHISTIRIYSQTSPYWFSAQDVKSMRFLADAKVLRLKEIFRKDADSLLIFEGAAPLVSQTHWKTHDVCGGQCGLLHRSVDNTDVFAFHLDRVLGLNRTLPAVGRRFGFLHGGQACQVVLWDASLYPKDLGGGPPTVKITWRQYQNSLTQSCWYRNVSPKSNSGCSSICHSEWSKLALFDFLLQIHNRLDPKCCGFRPRQEDACAESNRHTTCEDQENIQLANIVHREHDLRHLVFTYNKGVFDRHEDNLDFRLLEGIKELPEQAVSVLRKRKLREKLLQSLFLDQIYWESQGGRQGIDKLIDVIEKRANVLLTYINAHKIKVIPMNE